MKPDYSELLRKHNLHSVLIDKEGCIKAMDICFELGKKQGEKQVLTWFSKMDHLSENLKYLEEEYINQHK
jgi:hypothetical protein